VTEIRRRAVTVLAYGGPVCSLTGRASMSARSSTVGPSPLCGNIRAELDLRSRTQIATWWARLRAGAADQ
jgi:hypothetical protein